MTTPLPATPALAGVPVLGTPRLVLRAPGPQDADAFVAAHSAERARWVGGNLGREKSWRTLALEIGHWVLRGSGLWAVTLRGSDRCLGTVGCWFPEGWPEREIAWFVFPEAEGKGIAHEAALAARAHAYGALGWSTAVSYVHPENTRSIRLAERLGARRDDRAAVPLPADGTRAFRHPGPGAI